MTKKESGAKRVCHRVLFCAQISAADEIVAVRKGQ
jgi:hypothetical protein